MSVLDAVLNTKGKQLFRLSVINNDRGCILGQSKNQKLNLEFCDQWNTSIFCGDDDLAHDWF